MMFLDKQIRVAHARSRALPHFTRSPRDGCSGAKEQGSLECQQDIYYYKPSVHMRTFSCTPTPPSSIADQIHA